MKKIIYLFILILAGACSNQDIDFPDFEYNSVYFPKQYPVRTLVLGDARIDNSLDRELKFHIGAVIGGMYNNSGTWTIDYAVDNSLAQNLVNANGDEIVALPANYYSLSPENTITIPPGEFNGLIQVQLDDAFLNDTLSVTGRYVIPLRMTGSNADSILRGIPVVDNPDKRIPSHWDAGNQPKDFVLFGIKYINPYHGFYLHRGKDVTYNLDGEVVNEVIYSEEIVEKDQIWELVTAGRDLVIAKGIGINSGSDYAMKLKFNEDGSIVVDSVSTAPDKVYGTGQYVKDAEEWGGKKHDAIYLRYEYIEGLNTTAGELDTIGKINLTESGTDDAVYLPEDWTNITEESHPWPAVLANGITLDKNDVPLGDGVKGEATGPYPMGVSSSYNYIHRSVTDPVVLTLSGLDPTKTYNFDFYASRSADASGTRPTNFTILGETKSIDAVGNTSNIASFRDVPPDETGRIIINVANDPGQYAYINAIVITTEKSTEIRSHVVNDTLVFRNNGVVFEENMVTVQ